MTAPMVLIELVLMRAMYTDARANILAGLGSIALFAVCVYGIRTQFGVGDRDFLRAMIPHHSAAVLMCGKASLKDPEVKELCRSILTSQQAQIDWMRAKLGEIQ
jgi:hypothetical protein